MPTNTEYKIVTPQELTASFQTELQRLAQVGLTPELETIARRYYSDKERQSMSEDEFCGPHRSFPVKSQEDVTNAAGLAGHADNPDAVRACIRRKAKAHGWSLPESWGDDKKEDRVQEGVFLRADGNHDAFSGTHSHAHPSFGSGDGDSHEHEHSHDNDADHHHSHESQDRVQAPPTAIQTSDRHVMSLPLVRIDATKREVWGQATAEVPDSYGTIFGYYPEAWKKWRGNIREQHDPKKAVGKRIDLECNDQERAIYVGSRVSRGAQDTWLKVEDDVLAGYSASIIPDPEFGNDPRRWPRKEYNGKEYPYLPRYTVAELSLVDNPSCPGCNIQIVRADGFVTDVLDLSEDEPVIEQIPETQDRAGARVGSGTRSKMHESIGHTLHAAVSQMQNCGCDSCMKAQKVIDPDGDGDIDLGSFDDPDNDADSLYNGRDADMSRFVESVVATAIERALSSVYTRLQGIAGTLARSNTTPTNLEALVSSSLTRALEAAELPTAASLAEVRAELSAVKERVVQIAEQPMPGGPIQNASALPRPIEKRLPTDPYQMPQRSGSAVYDAVAALSRSGSLDTTEKQVDAVAAALMAQRGR